MRNFLKYSIILALLPMSMAMTAQCLAEQTFGDGTDTWSFTPDPAPFTNSAGSDYWGYHPSQSSPAPCGGANGWAVQDLQNPITGDSPDGTLTFDPVAVPAGVTEVCISAVVSTTPGWDGGDDFAFTPIVNGVNGTQTSFNSSLIGGATCFTTTIVVTVAPGDMVGLLVDVRNNGGSDTATFDDFCIKAVAPPCPDFSGFTTGMLNVEVVESFCMDGVLIDGTVAQPATPCPSGSTIQYSSDGGMTWSGTVPTYIQDTAITVDTRCSCDADGSVSEVSSVTTVPGTCPLCPDMDGIVEGDLNANIENSTCSTFGGSPDGGEILAPTMACPNESYVAYSIDGGVTWDSAIPTYNQTTAMTILTRCECDTDSSDFSLASTVTTVPGLCPECPDFTPFFADGALDVIIEESECDEYGGTPAGGTISPPAMPCPDGSTLQYSLNGGASWTEMLPVYDQTNSISVRTRCVCDLLEFVNVSSLNLTTNPGSCPECPDLSTLMDGDLDLNIINSTCSVIGGTPSGGTLTNPSTACPDGSILEYSLDGGTTWTDELPAYDQTNAITVDTRCACENDPTIISVASSITTESGVCPVCSVLSPMLDDTDICEGETTTLDATIAGTGVTYAWSNGGNTAMVTVGIGTYTVTVTDSDGCVGTAMASINNASPTCNISVVDETCGDSNGSATVIASLGAPPYTYLWSTGATGTMISNLPAGDYFVTVTDAMNCTSVCTQEIENSEELECEANKIDTGCGVSTGMITSMVYGAGPFTYAWSNGSTASIINNLSVGTYDLTVTDGFGCTSVCSETIIEQCDCMLDATAAGFSCFVFGGFAELNFCYEYSDATVGPSNSLMFNGIDAAGNIIGSIPIADNIFNGYSNNDCVEIVIQFDGTNLTYNSPLGGSFTSAVEISYFSLDFEGACITSNVDVDIMCGICTDLDDIAEGDLDLAVTNSSCDVIGGTPSGGVLANPTTTCPPGSVLDYKVEGSSWTTTLPTYDQENSMVIETRCRCLENINIVSEVSTTITDPQECPECNPIHIMAHPVCKGGEVGGTFDVVIDYIVGGSTTGLNAYTLSITGSGQSYTYPGTSCIENLTYTGQNNHLTLTVSEISNPCVEAYYVLQLNCAEQESCDCDTGEYSICAQAAGNGNGYSMVYALLDGAGVITSVNQEGCFDGLPSEDEDGNVSNYTVQGFNVLNNELFDAQAALIAGIGGNVTAVDLTDYCTESCAASYTANCGCPDISITKDDADNFDDTQNILPNGDAEFTITVENLGSENLCDIVISDAATDENLDVTNCIPSASELMMLVMASGDMDSDFEPGEAITFTCIVPAVSSSFTNSISVQAVGCDSGQMVGDMDDSDVTVPCIIENIVVSQECTGTANEYELCVSFDRYNVGPTGMFNIYLNPTGTALPTNFVAGPFNYADYDAAIAAGELCFAIPGLTGDAANAETLSFCIVDADSAAPGTGLPPGSPPPSGSGLPTYDCPVILGIMVNACGPVEGQNEFVIIQNGSTPITGSNIYIDTPSGDDYNSYESAATTTANIAAAGWICPCCVAIDGTSTVPADGVVVITGNALDQAYDFTNLCADAGTIYVLNEVSTATGGHFANSGGRTTVLNIGLAGAGCSSDSYTYLSSDLASGGDGDYVAFSAPDNPTYPAGNNDNPNGTNGEGSNNGCAGPESFVVEQPGAECWACTSFTEVPTTELVIEDNEICPGMTGRLYTVDTYASYMWSNGVTTQVNAGLAAGIYTVTVTDENGCQSTSSAEVIENNPPIVMMMNAEVCPGASATLDPGMGGVNATFLWSNGETTQTIDATVGSYSVVVTSEDGCTATAMFDVTELVAPTPSMDNVNVCPGDLGALDAGAGYAAYAWSDGSITRVNTLLGPGDYSVTVTDDNGCTGVTDGSVVEHIVTAPNMQDQTSCSDDLIMLDAGAGYASYEWNDGPPASTSQTILADMSFLYSVTVTDTNGCESTDDAHITIRELSNVSIEQNCLTTASDNYELEVCFEAEYTGGCGEYSIDVAGVAFGPFTYASTISGPGAYCVIITDPSFDATNQENGVAVTITDCDDEPSCSVTSTFDEEDCLNYDLAMLKLITTPGPYYPGQQVTFTIDVINQGDLDAYNVCVVDLLPADLLFDPALNPTWSLAGANPKTVLATLPALTTTTVTIELTISDNPTGSDMSNDAVITGAEDADGDPIADEDDDIDGSNPDSADETDNEIADDSQTLPGGFPIGDDPTDEDHFDFAEFFVCLMAATLEPVDLCDGERLVLSPTLDQGIAPFTFSWTGPNGFVASTGNIIINNTTLTDAGTYAVTIVDGNGCEASAETEVTVFELPVVEASSVEVLCVNADPYELIGSPVGGFFAGPGTVNGTHFDPSTIGSGEHLITYTFTDANGCSNTDAIYVKVHGAENLSCKGDLNVSLDQACSLGDLSVELFLDAHLDPEFYTFVLKDEYGNVIDINDIGSYAGSCIVYEVIDICTGNLCWGNMCIEDKIAPENFNCECEVPYIDDGNGGLIENPNCVFYCYDFWDLELLEAAGGNNEVLPPVDDATPTDNCLEFGDPEVHIQVFPLGDDCSTKSVVRTLTYTYLDYDGEVVSIECLQTYLFKPVDLYSSGPTVNGAWDGHVDIFVAGNNDGNFAYYTPEVEVIMPCGSDLTPESIAAHYDIDTPGRPDGVDRDDYPTQTPNIVEHNEGIPYAYPYVVVQGWKGFHAKPVLSNICNFYAVYSDQGDSACGGDCNGGKVISRTWNLLDWCSGETLEFVQRISSKDKEAPTIGNPDITVSVEPWDCVANVVMPQPEHLYDTCDDNPTWTVIPPAGYSVIDNTIIGVEKGSYQAWYEASDCCGNTSLYPVVINVLDQAAPTAIANQNIVVNLTSVLGSDGIAKIYAKDIDNFSYDACSDVKLEVRRADGNIWCHQGNATFNDDGHVDDDPADDDDGAFVIFCCEDVLLQQDDDGTYYGMYDVILRVWDDGDMNGIFGTAGDNYNEAWSTIRVEDKLIPTVICPLDIEINCEQDFNNFDLVGKPLVYTSCGDIECDDYNDNYTKKRANSAPFLGEEIPAYNQSCRTGAIRRTWNCEGQQCSQWIIVRADDTYELEIEWPQDTVINCLAEELTEPQYIGSPCELIGVSTEVDTFIFEEGACYKLLKHWTLISWCDYDASDSDINELPEPTDDGVIPGVYTHTQVVKLFDEDKPVVLAENQVVGTNVDCVTEGAYITAKATDEGACASDWIKWDVEIDLGGDLDIDYTFSSGLPTSDPFYIGPTSSSFVDSISLGNEVKVLLPDGIPAKCGTRHLVRYSAYDGCGNVTRVTKSLEIRDSKAPTPYMVDVSSALMQSGGVELWASDFNVGSFDNCSDGSELWYTFSPNIPAQLLDSTEEDPWYDVDGVTSQTNYGNGLAEKWNGAIGSSSMVFNCDALDAATNNGGQLEIMVYVWDACFNTDFAIVNLGLIDNMGACGPTNRAAISGNIKTESGEGIMDLMVEMTSDQPNYPVQNMTTQDGSYAFNNTPMYNDYIITGEKNDDWLNGVSTLDLLLIQRHILDLAPLTSPYKLIAADASNDENISGVDLIIIRKLILGIYSEYPNNDSWRLVDANEQLDPENPWPFTETLLLGGIDEDMIDQDFIGVKIGDVNGSVVSNFYNNINTENRSSQKLKFYFENQSVQIGDEILLEIKSQNFEDIFGFQFSLEINDFIVGEIIPGTLDVGAENFSYDKGRLNVSWNNTTSMTSMDEVLFTISLTANSGSDTKEMITIDDSGIRAEAYKGGSLQVLDLELNQTNILAENSLKQNEPNPWAGETRIDFNIERQGEVSITVFDLSGKILKVYNDEYERGQHSITVKEKDLLGAKGVLYYTIESGLFSATKKMIKIND